MTPMRDSYDVVILGAGIAGCTAARLYGQQGLRVALVDRRTRIDDYKRMCTHFIQPSATPVIERLGLAPLIEKAGGVRNSLDTWTRWGWIRVPEPEDGGSNPYGYSIRRQTLDPMLRTLAANTPGVELMLGKSAERLTSAGGRFTGVVVGARDGHEEELSARLVVAGDGRNSEVGELSGVKARVRPNKRFTYFAYYRNLVQASGETGQMWVLEPNTAIAYPNDDEVKLVACFVERSRLAEFKRDPEGNFERLIESLPMGPNIAEAERVSPVLGKLEMPNSARRTAVPGLAFIGDAAMTADPLWAIGCGWAFQSPAWLVDETTEALLSDNDLDRALRRYRKKHRSELLAFYLQSSNFSTRRRLLPHEKLILSSAAKDPVMARHFTAFGEGLIGLGEFLSPRSLGRAMRIVLTHRFSKTRRQDQLRGGPGAARSK
jgi:2-polyprenyl-6-methoxyphenol hydroxylase-like FAD-dependent oxidoreductase